MYEPVLCIPRVPGNVSKDYVKSIFDKLSWGETVNVSVVNKSNMRNNRNQLSVKNTLSYSCVFITLKWFKNDAIESIKTKLMNNESIKLVYNDIVFWKIYAKK